MVTSPAPPWRAGGGPPGPRQQAGGGARTEKEQEEQQEVEEEPTVTHARTVARDQRAKVSIMRILRKSDSDKTMKNGMMSRSARSMRTRSRC